MIAVLLCLTVMHPGGLSTSLGSTADDRHAAPLTAADDGFTRESMAELGRPAPAPPPTTPIVSARVVRSRVHSKRVFRSQVDSKDFVADRHQKTRHAPPDGKQVRVASHAHRRNPVVSFVYWWNGFVIKTFHTKVGTVMLHTVGAKT